MTAGSPSLRRSVITVTRTTLVNGSVFASHTLSRSCSLDTTDPDSVEAALDAAESALGPVCHLVTSAGIIRKAAFLELEVAAWRRTLDINLPGISGIRALRILAEDPVTARIPVIALSANAMPRDIEKGLEAGFFRYLTKPIKVNEFMDTLDLALKFAQGSAYSPPEGSGE